MTVRQHTRRPWALAEGHPGAAAEPDPPPPPAEPKPARGRLGLYPLLILLIGAGVIVFALAKGALPSIVDVGSGALHVEFDNSAAGQAISEEQARSAQPELEERIRVLEEQAQDNAAPPSPADAVVAGTWQADNGFTYVLQQFGSSVVLQEQSSAFGITATGTGTVTGDTVAFQFRALNNTTGSSLMQVTSSPQTGMTLTGTFTNDWTGMTWPVTMTRVGP